MDSFRFSCHCLCGRVIDDHAPNRNLMTVAPMAWVPSSTVKFIYFYFLFFFFTFVNIKSTSGVNLALSYYYFITQVALEERYLRHIDFLNLSFIKKKTYPSGIKGPGTNKSTVSPLSVFFAVTWEVQSGLQGAELWGNCSNLSSQAPSPGEQNSSLQLQLWWPLYSECFTAWLKMCSCLKADCQWGLY